MNLIAGLTAFFLGAIHALEPGHGKSAIAAYAVGYRSSLRHILVLGLSTALAHTVIILLLAAIFGGVASAVADERAHQWIEIGSAFLILLTGAWLLQRAIKRRKSNEDCRNIETSCNCRSHRETIDENKPISFGVVGLLGISSGLIPCPTALAVLLSAMTAGHFFGGLWTVCLFSIGLAVTLCAVALLAAFVAKSSLKIGFLQHANLPRIATAMPLVSAWLITGSGVFMLFRAVFLS